MRFCTKRANLTTDAQTFHLLEDWRPSPTGTRGETRYLDLMTTFQNRVLLGARRVASGSAKDAESLAPLTPQFKRKLRDMIIQTEGLMFEGILTLGRGSEVVDATSVLSRRTAAESAAPTDPEARLLYTLSSFHRLTETSIPSFMRKVGDQIGGDAAAIDSATLEEMIEQMDEVMFNEYVSHRSEPLCNMLRRGVVGIDWMNMPPPSEVRPYMHQVMLLLVEAHARVGDNAPALVDRVVENLIDRVCDTALDVFRRVGRFGTGGMLTATLEIEFLNQSVAGYLSPHAKKVLKEVFNIISQGYRRPQGGESMQRDLENMRKILESTRRGAGVETLCFRRKE